MRCQALSPPGNQASSAWRFCPLGQRNDTSEVRRRGCKQLAWWYEFGRDDRHRDVVKRRAETNSVDDKAGTANHHWNGFEHAAGLMVKRTETADRYTS